MFVKTFVGNTLDETLKSIKKELGPDAIILKTVTNKGIKGALKKNRIEITATIPKREYEKKIKVDKVLTENQKEQLYKSPASYISEKIEDYDDKNASPQSGYGKLALNKAVKNNLPKEVSQGLEEFLKSSSKESLLEKAQQQAQKVAPPMPSAPVQNLVRTDLALDTRSLEKNDEEINRKLEDLDLKIKVLTKKVEASKVDLGEKSIGLSRLKNYLQAMDLDDSFIQEIIKKAMLELKKEDLDDFDTLYDFTLSECNNAINVDGPLFSSIQAQNKPVVTVLVSDLTCGQTTLAYKLASMKNNSVIISYSKKNNSFQKVTNQKAFDLPEKLFSLQVFHVDQYADIFNQARKAIASGKSVFIDFKRQKDDQGFKVFINDLKRSFELVETLLCLSATHSPRLNHQQLYQYEDLVQGLSFTGLDQCLSFVDIFNLHWQSPQIPVKFFSTGPLIPDDLESASRERIIAGCFKL